MGICFSKKKKKKQTLISDPNPKEALVLEVKELKKPKNKNPIQIRTQTQKVEVEVELREEVKPPNEAQRTVEKKKPAVFVSTQNPIDNDEEPLPATVRTSNCSKEEVDAILIQCGRLSRSSSSKAAASAAADRKYSGSKRSYDFDNDKSLMDEEVENHMVSRPSPSPSPRGKRTPNRERNGGGGGASRRVSRSPGRRSAEGVGALNVGERNAKQQQQQQPAKMVSVPAREKGVSSTGSAKKGGGGAAASTTNRRNASSARSRSPANNGRVLSENAGVHQVQPQLLSRSSSRKAENSPSRRNPMTEIDENSLRGNNTTNKKKTTDVVTIKKNNNINSFVREQLKSCRQKEKEKEKEKEPEIVEEGKEMKEEEMFNNRALTRTRSSRKSSRDFDHILGLNYPDTNATTAYTSSSSSLLVEDIQNHYQVSLPACVSKACSILEAVADLNSSSSDQPNGRFARRGLNQKDPLVETEVKGKDDLMEPCLEKYTSEMEPQESAGSNSIVGQPWHSSWEMNSVDSTDRYWTTSQSNHGEEPDEESSAIRDFEARGKSLRGGGSSGNKRRDFDNRQVVRGGGGNAKGGGRRALSNPVAAASSS